MIVFRLLFGSWLFLFFLAGFASASDSRSFDVDKPFIYVVVEQGQTAPVSFSLLNNGNARDFVFFSRFSDKFFSLDKSSMHLDSGSNGVNDVLLGSDTLQAGVYVGSVEVSSNSESLVIPVVLEVQSSQVLFDSSIRELPSFAHLSPGSTFSPELVLYNLRSLENGADLHYALYDLSGNKIVDRKQSVDVKNNLELAVALPLDRNLPEGDYVFAVDIRSAWSVGTISSLIHVDSSVLASPPTSNRNNLLSYAFGAVIVLLIAFLLINYLWRRRLVSTASYWDQQLKSVKDGSDDRRAFHKLVYQKNLLQEAYKKKYVSLSTYNRTKSKIDLSMTRLKKRL